MKNLLATFILVHVAIFASAQTDSTSLSTDTIKVGSMLIIKQKGSNNSSDTKIIRSKNYRRRSSNFETNWFVFDLGFANVNDKTVYGVGQAQSFAPGLTKDNFSFRTGKTSNVNIWLFMQRINLASHVLNFKYGVGIEMYNFRFEENIKFLTDPTKVVISTDNYTKNKLATQYVTVPVMLNFNLTPHRQRSFGFSVGASFSYLYSSYQKTKGGPDGKTHNHNSFDLEPWKISYIAELNLDWVKFYGIYSAQNMWQKGLNWTPYAIGIRISDWSNSW